MNKRIDKLIDADALCRTLDKRVGSPEVDARLMEVNRVIMEMPHVDAVKVVRCRDCRYWRQEVTSTAHWVCAHHSNNERRVHTMPDFYCAAGERRSEDESET